ncbi:GGDEF domain-containing protein [Proteinivorax tanatarense]|uniref:GGDEF domain-containing protein n=1 Tax=Proteinivorax tanatarense TaxID=1260629 RepID=A0AAU7VIZ8_9FIRM
MLKVRLILLLFSLYPFILLANFYFFEKYKKNIYLLTTVALICVFIAILRKIYLFIKHIYNDSEKIVNGNLTTCVKMSEEGYFNTVAKAYNNMLDKIHTQRLDMEKLSYQDHLTGLGNRRMLDKALEFQIIQSDKAKLPLSLLALDIDDFKKINDTYGHLFGDTVLAEIASIFNVSLRKSDVAARFGGEEFVILLPNTSLNDAKRVAEKIRKEVNLLHFQSDKKLVSISITIGVSSINQIDNSLPIKSRAKILLEKADKALYFGKGSGKNNVSV